MKHLRTRFLHRHNLPAPPPPLSPTPFPSSWMVYSHLLGGTGFLDLDEMPIDLNEEVGSIPRNYFTQLLYEAIGESPQPANVPDPGMGDAQATATNTDTTFLNATNASLAIPEGDDDDDASSQPNEPYVGMRFDTLLEARNHYNSYAARKGFSMKQNTNRRSTYTGVLEKQQFACNQFRKPKKDDGGAEKAVPIGPLLDPVPLDEVEKEAADIASVIAELDGLDPKKRKPPNRKRETIKRSDCKAKMVVKLKDGRWEVISFVAERTHPLLWKPSLTKYLRSHHGIPHEEKEFVKHLYSSNLTAGEMMGVMSEFYGTEMLVPYTSKTITNYCATLQTQSKEGDMAKVLNYFNEQKEKDPDFYCRLKLDAEDRVENLFWVDGAARRAYAEAYHDCVSFDATYLTNKYNMPFAPFIGINRHVQSIMLGCGFVRQELATSYDWLFESFLIAMNGLAPDNIITDQDGAMRLKCGPILGRNPRLPEDFNDCIDFSFSPEEFEAKWALFMGKWHVAAGHPHFHVLYENRASWVPCYFKHRFFPFLQSTQRSEGFNAILKRYINPHKSVFDFVRQYEKLQVHILVREGGNDYRTYFLELEPWSPFPVEAHAYKVYTTDIYLRFRNEFELIGRYNVSPFGGNYYKLEPNMSFCAKYSSRTYLVIANKDEGLYSCECSKMDIDGMLCCHILKMFTHLGVDEIPERYILKRWTQQAVLGFAGPATAPQPDVIPPESQKQLRHANLNMSFSKVAKLASASDAPTAILNRHIRAAATEISQLNKSRKKRKTPSVGPSTSAPAEPEPVIPRDPAKSTTKGRTKTHRTVSALELHPKQTVKCSLCGSQFHNIATCPRRFL
ncbi:hypothetical protein ACQ4PT_045200 [Festuca glaucescens]